jgi:hypothetical protein
LTLRVIHNGKIGNSNMACMATFLKLINGLF